MMTRQQIFLVDDHEVFRRGLRSEIERHVDFGIAGEAGSWAEALEGIARSKPDLVVLDINLSGSGPGPNGITVAADLRRSTPTTPTMVLSEYGYHTYIMSMLAEGVSGYLLKAEPLTEIVRAMRGILEGRSGWFSRAIADRISRMQCRGQALTDRETQVLQIMYLSNENVAKALGVTPSTAKKHVANILAKLGLPSRAAAVAYAFRNGFIPPEHFSPEVSEHNPYGANTYSG